MSDYPYVRELGRCELCGAAGKLVRVVLKPGGKIPARHGRREGVRLDRVVYVCARHERQGSLEAPRQTTRPVTSKLRPQAETLFGGGAP